MNNKNINICLPKQMIKFYYQRYEQRKFWSHKRQTYYQSFDISDQVWDSPGHPCKGELLDMHSIIRKLPKTSNKSERSAIMRFYVDEFPLKEYIGFDKWNGIIFIDLDLNKSKKFNEKINTKEKIKHFYDVLSELLYNLSPCNFYMIEHSSSGIGLHILFYFDVEKTEDNFFKCAEWCRDLLMNKIISEDYDIINDFCEMISEDKVFDIIYKRPYQKCFITGIDAYINDFATGEFDISKVTLPQHKSKENAEPATYEITSFNINKDKKWLTDHNERFYLYTALKKATKSEEELNIYWRQLCQHFELYKDYTVKKFYNEFDYSSIKADTGHISLLRKYGIKIDTSKNHIDLGDGYLGDKRDIILNLLQNGINFCQAPTGSGKTKIWIDYNIDLLGDILNLRKPILVVEPLNSIIETKYDDKVITIIGSKQFPKTITSYAMYVTNFNKLLKKGYGDTWTIRQDIDEFLSQFDLIILDESHILIKDSFRCKVLIPFIRSINKATNHTKIIFQTATPMHEEMLFDIRNYIICHKENNIKTKWIFRRCQDDRFDISQITCLVNYYVSNGRKVYVYWNNASLSQLNAFKATYINPSKIAIFHKRNTGEESMERIATYHRLKTEDYEYDVLLSSVYFGVGNDLDDEVNAAVIIIGNNTWQEDIQAVGRWRNSKDVEVCQIILPNEYEFVKNTSQEEININVIKKDKIDYLTKIWNDKTHKDKSVIINHKAYMIEHYEDIEHLSTMMSADIYDSQFIVKINKLSNSYYNYMVKEDFTKVLECNADFTNSNKLYWKSIKDERNLNKKNIMNGTIDYDVINKDTKLIKFKSLWDQLKRYEIDKLLGPKYISATTHYHLLKCWVDYYKALLARSIDYPEIYSLLWYRNHYDKETKNEEIDINGFKVTEDEYNMFLAYIMYVHNKNKGCKDYDIKANYIMPFKYNCKLFVDMPDVLIDKMYSTYDKSEIDISASKEFFSDYEWKDEEFENAIIHNMHDILKQTEHMNKEVSKIQFIFKMFFNNCKIGGHIGGKKSSPKKKVIITEEFKKAEKYRLKTGQEFESATDLAIYANVSNKTVTQWISKKWVIKSV